MMNKVTTHMSSTYKSTNIHFSLSDLLENSFIVCYYGERLHLYTFNVKCLNTDIRLQNVTANYISSSENSKSSSG